MKYRLSSYWAENILAFLAPPSSLLMGSFFTTLRSREDGASLDLLNLFTFFYSKSLSDQRWWIGGIEEG